MVIVAHPDDAEFGCGGTVARWVQAGAEVAYVLSTSGDVGIAKPGMTKTRAAEIREAEQLAAAKLVGVTDVTFLRIPDGTVACTLELRRRLVREIRRFKPELVVVDDPTLMFTRFGVNHPDHRATGLAAVDAIFPACGQPNLFEELADEGLTAHKVRQVYVMSRGEGDVFVDISSTINLKIAALKAHDSQLGDWADLGDRMREWTANIGQGREMAHAEAFRLVTLISDEDWEKQTNID
jgi:LmbE family N-acetylglucosaminyl deacetylase